MCKFQKIISYNIFRIETRIDDITFVIPPTHSSCNRITVDLTARQANGTSLTAVSVPKSKRPAFMARLPDPPSRFSRGVLAVAVRIQSKIGCATVGVSISRSNSAARSNRENAETRAPPVLPDRRTRLSRLHPARSAFYSLFAASTSTCYARERGFIFRPEDINSDGFRDSARIRGTPSKTWRV